MNMVPIIIPMNHTRTVECITSSGKTYCERSDLSAKDAGFFIIATVVWISILMYLLIKFAVEDISGWYPAGFTVISLILLGLTLIFI